MPLFIDYTLTFKDQVEDLTGLTIEEADQNELSQFLTNGAADVINHVVAARPEKAMQFADSKVSADANGLNLNKISTEILSVTLGLGTTEWEDVTPTSGEDATLYEWDSIDMDWVSNNYPCDRIDHSEANESYNILSLKYRTLYNAGWFMRNGYVLTTPLPLGGVSMNVTYVEYPIVTHDMTPQTESYIVPAEKDDSGIVIVPEYEVPGLDKFPTQYSPLIAIYAAVKVLGNEIGSTKFTTDLPSAPSAPGDAPASPGVPASPDLPDVPDAPDAPSISYSAAAVGGSIIVAQDSIAVAQDSIATAQDGVNASIESYTGETDSTSDVDASYTSAGSSGTSSVHSNIGTWVETEEDSEMAQAAVGQVNALIQDFQASIQDASAAMQASIINAQNNISVKTSGMQSLTGAGIAKMQAATTAAVSKMNASTGAATAKMQSSTQAATQKMVQSTTAAIQNMQLSTNVNITNAAKALEASIADYQAELQKYTTEIQNYGAVAQSGVQKYTAEIQGYATEIQKYGAEVQNYNNVITKINTEYQWLVDQQNRLRQEYVQAFQMMVTPEQSIKTELMDEKKKAQVLPAARGI